MLRIQDAFSLSEAGSKFSATHQQSPVCARFARLDWGYEKFSPSGAASTGARLLLSPHKAEGLSAISASHTYHLRGSINSAALREKSDNQGAALGLNIKVTMSGRVSAGKGFMPFQKQCSTYFSQRLDHFSAVGSLLWKGMKPFPALGSVTLYHLNILANI